MQSSGMTDEWLEEHLISPDDEGIDKSSTIQMDRREQIHNWWKCIIYMEDYE